jgi:hypothetical protein
LRRVASNEKLRAAVLVNLDRCSKDTGTFHDASGFASQIEDLNKSVVAAPERLGH